MNYKLEEKLRNFGIRFLVLLFWSSILVLMFCSYYVDNERIKLKEAKVKLLEEKTKSIK